MKFKSIQISQIFDSEPTNSKVTRTFCNSNPGPIPVYASSKKESEYLGKIQDNLPGVRYYNNCLSYNRNGSVGYVFFRNHKFTTNEDHRVLKLKENFIHILDYQYLRYELQNMLLSLFSYSDKAGINKINDLNLNIPVNEKGEFDIKKQRNIANKYALLETLENNLKVDYNEFQNFNFSLTAGTNVKEFSLEQIFIPIKGSSKYTNSYVTKNKGEFPLYSSKTSNEGIIGFINTYDYDKKCITWTTDGIYAGTVFLRKDRFSMTTHCGALFLKDEYEDLVNIEYIYFTLKSNLRDYAVGEGNKRLTTDIIKKVSVDLPVDRNGAIDLSAQLLILKKYVALNRIKESVVAQLSDLSAHRVVIS